MVLKEDPGNEKMIEVSGYIESGAKTFIKVQYKVLILFVGGLAVLLLFFIEPGEISIPHVIAYIIGAAGSMWAGWMGMMVGVKANTFDHKDPVSPTKCLTLLASISDNAMVSIP